MVTLGQVRSTAVSASKNPLSVDELLTPSEVAAIFRVDPKTVTRWARAGRLTSVKTLGGHRRYRADQVHGLYEQLTTESTVDT